MARRLPSWWKRLSRPSILEEDAGIQNTTTNNELDVLEEAQKAVLEQQIVDDGQGNNAWLFAAEKEAPCCLNCGKRFSVVITRHNCRACSMAVCSECSSRRLQVFPNVRVCCRCFEVNENRSKFEMVPRPAPFIIKRGRLTKMGSLVRSWRTRTWILDSNGLLSYFGKDMKRPKGTLNTCRLIRWISGESTRLDSIPWRQGTDRTLAFALEFERKIITIVADEICEVRAWRVLVSMFARQCLGCGESLFNAICSSESVDTRLNDSESHNQTSLDLAHGAVEDDDEIGDVNNTEDEDDGESENEHDEDEDKNQGHNQEQVESKNNSKSKNNIDSPDNNCDSTDSICKNLKEAAACCDDNSSDERMDNQDCSQGDDMQTVYEDGMQQQCEDDSSGNTDKKENTDNICDKINNQFPENASEPLKTARSSTGESDLKGRGSAFHSDAVAVLVGSGTAFHRECFQCISCQQGLNPEETADITVESPYNIDGYVYCHSDAFSVAQLDPVSIRHGTLARGVVSAVTLLPAAVRLCNCEVYEELRSAAIRRHAQRAAEQQLAAVQEKSAAQADDASQSQENIQTEPQITPQIVMCSMLGVVESLTAVQDMLATNSFDGIGPRLRRRTTLPNGMAYDMVDYAPKEFESLRRVLNIKSANP